MRSVFPFRKIFCSPHRCTTSITGQAYNNVRRETDSVFFMLFPFFTSLCILLYTFKVYFYIFCNHIIFNNRIPILFYSIQTKLIARNTVTACLFSSARASQFMGYFTYYCFPSISAKRTAAMMHPSEQALFLHFHSRIRTNKELHFICSRGKEMVCLMKTDEQYRTSFNVFKSNICHLVKDKGDRLFILETLKNNEIRRLYDLG